MDDRAGAHAEAATARWLGIQRQSGVEVVVIEPGLIGSAFID
jgi:hypothetical protein